MMAGKIGNRYAVLIGILAGVVATVALGALAADTDSATTNAFTVTLSDTVRIQIAVQPPASIAFPGAAGRPALESRFFALGNFQATVYAITNYQVGATIASVTGTGAAAVLAHGANSNNLLQAQITTFAGSDDLTDNPVSDVSSWTGLLSTADVNLWHGGNTEGGSLTGQTATVNLQLDLDEVGDQAQGNTLVVTLTLTVTEN
jgi:hypothetical protein